MIPKTEANDSEILEMDKKIEYRIKKLIAKNAFCKILGQKIVFLMDYKLIIYI